MFAKGSTSANTDTLSHSSTRENVRANKSQAAAEMQVLHSFNQLEATAV